MMEGEGGCSLKFPDERIYDSVTNPGKVSLLALFFLLFFKEKKREFLNNIISRFFLTIVIYIYEEQFGMELDSRSILESLSTTCSLEFQSFIKRFG
jgi:hypothetical protein